MHSPEQPRVRAQQCLTGSIKKYLHCNLHRGACWANNLTVPLQQVCCLHGHVFPEPADKYISSEHCDSTICQSEIKISVAFLPFPSFCPLAFLPPSKLRVSQRLLFGNMAVFSLLLEREENAVGLLAPLLLGDANAGRRRGRERRVASVVAGLRLGRAPDLEGRANLARKLTPQTEDDGSRVMDVNRTYGDEKERKMGFFSFFFLNAHICPLMKTCSPETVTRPRRYYAS